LSPRPWWIDRVAGLLAPHDASALELGPLWHLSERLDFIRQNVDGASLASDLVADPSLAQAWAAFGARDLAVRAALARASGGLAERLRTGGLGPVEFRATWEALGFVRNAEGAGTPADDYLDGLLSVSRFADDLDGAEHGHLNLPTRAARVADFLSVTQPTAQDVVFDLGSGSGKLALTVGASSAARVRGVEFIDAHAAEASRGASRLGLSRVDFACADVRDVDLAGGTIFYLYYPFHGPVARAVADTLGALGREKAITIYASGPVRAYGEHFLGQSGLTLVERRGEFGDVMVLRSAGALEAAVCGVDVHQN
jgi:hypothetical protein